MLYRRFGRTNLNMPLFSCGGMRYQQSWKDVPLSELDAKGHANLQATIRRALDVGVNHIETARGYGSSERQLGLILPSYPREKLIVQTKIGPEDDPRKFTQNFEDSLSRLKLDYVDLLAVHGVNDDHTAEQTLRPGGCLAAARAIQKRGLARHVGFSTHAPLRVILRAIRHDADGGFDYVNLHWYWIFQSNWPAVLEATARDMGVFIISPSDKGGKLYEPPEKLARLTAPLHPLVFNDLFCLSHPQVHTLSVGAARPSDFDEHLKALPLLEDAPRVLAPILDRLERECSALPSELRDPLSLDLPEPSDTPGGLNIPVILWLHSLAMAYDMIDYGKMRYNLLGNGGHWFPGQTAASLDTIDLGDVAQRSGLGERLVPLLRAAHAQLGSASVKRLSQS